MLRVTIVGGGVSGVAIALRLARSERPIQVDLVEPRSLLGAGLTYTATDPRHRVNVPTTRMSVEGEVVGASEIAPRANAVADRLFALEPVAGEERVLEGTVSGGG